MKILFACGGTAGHINPALAVAGTIRQKHPGAEILFAGNPGGMEARLVPQAGFDFTPIRVKGFQRKLSWYNIKNNVMAVAYLTTAPSRARKILEEFRPDVVMGTGDMSAALWCGRRPAAATRPSPTSRTPFPASLPSCWPGG